MSSARVVVLGNANVDLTTYVDHVPQLGETVLGTDFSIGMGGKGANQAVAASRGGANVAFIGSIGRDFFGDMIASSLSAERLDLTHLARKDEATGVASIYVDSAGANQIAVYLGASNTVEPEAVCAAISACESARFLVSQLEISQDVVLAGLRHAKDRGLTTVLNTAPFSPLVAGVLDHCDWLVANEVETQALLEGAGIIADVEGSAEHVLAQIPQWSTTLGVNLVVTLGAKGSAGYERAGGSFLAAAPSVDAVDTVGAGDCFVGYFVALLDAGCAWQQALTGAVYAASASVQRPGAQSSYPDPSEADTFHQLARGAQV